MFHTPAHKNTDHPAGQVSPANQGKTLEKEIKEYLAQQTKEKTNDQA